MAGGPLVSVLIPVYRAHTTLARCLASLLAQTLPDWEAVIAVDDGDPGYPELLAAAGIADPRIRFVATDGVRTGVAHARNVALAAARGRLAAPLDADDTMAPERLATLAPLALARGAASDNVQILEDTDGALLRLWLEPGEGTVELDADRLLDDPVPVLPVVDRALGIRWVEVPICDDVVFNLLLLDRLGSYPIVRRAMRVYRQRPDSECNAPDAVFRAEAGYRRVLAMLDSGELVLRPELAQKVRASFRRRIALNAAFGRARARGWVGSYQAFVARLSRCGRGSERSRGARTRAR
ncbi:MAG: glycosyltransferase [Geminicoccaceae bacterium]|nr:glycosyltransferase [Geminicoccaceae bacterium]MCX8101805.1 glycosyltransferase [Geminicoccaceae bacterium]MDW8369651.1 glycosyltransferase [Geminicoccaceae bacterium]